MPRTLGVMLLGAGALTWGLAADRSAARADDNKGPAIEVANFKSRAPADWKEEEPSNKFRLQQMRVPKTKDDPRDAELTVFFFGGNAGSNEENIKRQKAKFLPPEGKKIEEVTKVEKMKVADQDVTYVDIQGTYLHKDRPFDPNAKVEKRPDYRLLYVIFETAKGPYYIQLIGPAKTVEQNRKGFETMIKSFK